MRFTSGPDLPEVGQGLQIGHVWHCKRTGKLYRFSGGIPSNWDNWKCIGDAGSGYVHAVLNDPSHPAEGQYWYNIPQERLKMYSNGAVIAI